MKIANADKLKEHFEHVVMVKNFTVPEILTIIDRFSMNMAITDDERMLSLHEEYVIVPSLTEGKWTEVDDSGTHYCSECDWDADFKYLYCPSCGAFMVNSPWNKLGGTEP